MEHYKPLVLSVASAGTSIVHLIVAVETRNAIAWLIGGTAGLYSIYASHMAARASKAIKKKTDEEIKALQQQNRFSENN